MSAASRKKAWETRRAKYGPRGNNGSYTRPATGPCSRCAALEALVIKLHVEGVCSEGQAARATGLHRIAVRELADEFEMRHTLVNAQQENLTEGDDRTSDRDRDRLIEDIASGLADVDASHEVFHQRPYMEWAARALEIVERRLSAQERTA